MVWVDVAMVAKSSCSADTGYIEQPLANSSRYKRYRTICCVDSIHGSQKPTVVRFIHPDISRVKSWKGRRNALLITANINRTAYLTWERKGQQVYNCNPCKKDVTSFLWDNEQSVKDDDDGKDDEGRMMMGKDDDGKGWMDGWMMKEGRRVNGKLIPHKCYGILLD